MTKPADDKKQLKKEKNGEKDKGKRKDSYRGDERQMNLCDG